MQQTIIVIKMSNKDLNLYPLTRFLLINRDLRQHVHQLNSKWVTKSQLSSKLDAGAAAIMWASNCSARRKQNNEKLLSVSQSVVGAHLRAGGCWEFKAPYVRSFHPVLPFLETRRRKARTLGNLSCGCVCAPARGRISDNENMLVYSVRRNVPFFKLIGCRVQCRVVRKCGETSICARAIPNLEA
jgi:hypothetical protein